MSLKVSFVQKRNSKNSDRRQNTRNLQKTPITRIDRESISYLLCQKKTQNRDDEIMKRSIYVRGLPKSFQNSFSHLPARRALLMEDLKQFETGDIRSRNKMFTP